MGNRVKHDPGTFCWVELMTSDARRAKKFYGDVMGWQTDDDPIPGGGVYTMLRLEGGDVGGLYALPEDQKSAGTPPNWQPYVSVQSAAATTARARALGGTVIKDAFDVMNIGAMAVLRDPVGATFSIWEPKLHMGFDHTGGRPGTVCWNELGTTDPERAGRFYGDLFGWIRQTMPMPDGNYTLFMDGEHKRGGMFEIKGPMAGMHPAWLTYFAVEDCDASAAKVTAGGGNEVAPPTDIPGLGRFAIATDPQGAFFCLVRLLG